MINNERQYNVTQKRIQQFEETLAMINEAEIDEFNRELHVSAIESQIEELRNEILEYEQLKLQNISQVVVPFENLPEILIKGRIAHGWTHAQLANKIGIAEQQIQRYEASGYASASFSRLVFIAEAMELQIDNVRSKLKSKPLVIAGIDPDRLQSEQRRIKNQRTLLSI